MKSLKTSSRSDGSMILQIQRTYKYMKRRYKKHTKKNAKNVENNSESVPKWKPKLIKDLKNNGKMQPKNEVDI